jgi:hypothetical protein
MRDVDPRRLGPGTQHRTQAWSLAQDPGPRTWNLGGPGPTFQGPDPGPWTRDARDPRDPGPRTRNSPGTWDMEPGTLRPEPAAQDLGLGPASATQG